MQLPMHLTAFLCVALHTGLLAHAAAPEAVCKLPPGPEAAASTASPVQVLVYASTAECELAAAALANYAKAAGALGGTTLQCADLYDSDYTNLFGVDCVDVARRLNAYNPVSDEVADLVCNGVADHTVCKDGSAALTKQNCARSLWNPELCRGQVCKGPGCLGGKRLCRHRESRQKRAEWTCQKREREHCGMTPGC